MGGSDRPIETAASDQRSAGTISGDARTPESSCRARVLFGSAKRDSTPCRCDVNLHRVHHFHLATTRGVSRSYGPEVPQDEESGNGDDSAVSLDHGFRPRPHGAFRWVGIERNTISSGQRAAHTSWLVLPLSDSGAQRNELMKHHCHDPRDYEGTMLGSTAASVAANKRRGAGDRTPCHCATSRPLRSVTATSPMQPLSSYACRPTPRLMRWRPDPLPTRPFTLTAPDQHNDGECMLRERDSNSQPSGPPRGIRVPALSRVIPARQPCGRTADNRL